MRRTICLIGLALILIATFCAAQDLNFSGVFRDEGENLILYVNHRDKLIYWYGEVMREAFDEETAADIGRLEAHVYSGFVQLEGEDDEDAEDMGKISGTFSKVPRDNGQDQELDWGLITLRIVDEDSFEVSRLSKTFDGFEEGLIFRRIDQTEQPEEPEHTEEIEETEEQM